MSFPVLYNRFPIVEVRARDTTVFAWERTKSRAQTKGGGGERGTFIRCPPQSLDHWPRIPREARGGGGGTEYAMSGVRVEFLLSLGADSSSHLNLILNVGVS